MNFLDFRFFSFFSRPSYWLGEASRPMIPCGRCGGCHACRCGTDVALAVCCRRTKHAQENRYYLRRCMAWHWVEEGSSFLAGWLAVAGTPHRLVLCVVAIGRMHYHERRRRVGGCSLVTVTVTDLILHSANTKRTRWMMRWQRGKRAG